MENVIVVETRIHIVKLYFNGCRTGSHVLIFNWKKITRGSMTKLLAIYLAMIIYEESLNNIVGQIKNNKLI